MKELNRRAFLTLTGAAVAMMALAACGDEPYAPPAPPAPPAPTTSKEAELVAAINKVWKEKYDAKAVVHEQLTLNQDAVGAIRCYGRVFEEAIPAKLSLPYLFSILSSSPLSSPKMILWSGSFNVCGVSLASSKTRP